MRKRKRKHFEIDDGQSTLIKYGFISKQDQDNQMNMDLNPKKKFKNQQQIQLQQQLNNNQNSNIEDDINDNNNDKDENKEQLNQQNQIHQIQQNYSIENKQNEEEKQIEINLNEKKDQINDQNISDQLQNELKCIHCNNIFKYKPEDDIILSNKKINKYILNYVCLTCNNNNKNKIKKTKGIERKIINEKYTTTYKCIDINCKYHGMQKCYCNVGK